MNAQFGRLHAEPVPPGKNGAREPAVLKLLRWRGQAPFWWDPFVGLLVGIVAVAFRHALMGFDLRLTYVVFFPFIALASLLGRPAMGGTVIVVTVLYLYLLLWSNGAMPPVAHTLAYVTFTGAVIAMCDGFMRALAVAEADRERAQTRESFYASLVAASNDAIVTTTLEGIITGWNPAAVRILGYDEHEVIGRPADILQAPDRAAEEGDTLTKIRRGEAITHFLTVRKTRFGALLDVSLTMSPIFDAAGAVSGASHIMRDVTRDEQSAEALRDSEALLRSALQGAKAGTWQRDYITGRYVWSPRFYELHDVDPKTYSPSFIAWSKNVVEEDREATMKDVRGALESKATDYYSLYRVRVGAGEFRWVEIFGLIEREADGTIRRTTGIALDVSERQRGLEDLARANDNLVRANSSLKRFSSIAAHDLQEPLRKVEQFGDLLQQEFAAPLAGDGAYYVQIMRDSARRMRALINALLNFSRAANRELTMIPIDMNEALRQAQIACAAAIEETGAQIEVETLPMLHGDAVLVTQLFQNLISNAVKYSKPGRRPQIRVGDSGVGRSAAIFVRDEGIGIDREHHEKIFEAFTRLNTREKVQGAGIGLAFCRTVCERHGWRLEVRSERDGGSVFSVTAPRHQAIQAA